MVPDSSSRGDISRARCPRSILAHHAEIWKGGPGCEGLHSERPGRGLYLGPLWSAAPAAAAATSCEAACPSPGSACSPPVGCYRLDGNSRRDSPGLASSATPPCPAPAPRQLSLLP